MASITFIISGGTPEYTVSIDGYTGIPVEWTFYAPGEYTIDFDYFDECYTLLIQDSTGCIASAYDCCPTVVWDAEFINHPCEQTWECDLDYNILEISFLTTTTTTTCLRPSPLLNYYIMKEINYSDSTVVNIQNMTVQDACDALTLKCNDPLSNANGYTGGAGEIAQYPPELGDIVYQQWDKTNCFTFDDGTYILTTDLFGWRCENDKYIGHIEDGIITDLILCSVPTTTTTTTVEPTTTTTTTAILTTTTSTTVEPYEYCVNFGLLYNGYVHQDGRQLTSSNDWIVSQNPQSNSDPDLDWDILFGYSGDGYPTGSTAELKDTNSDYWNSPNTGAMNSKKFNARGGGFRLGNGTFLDLKNYAVFGDGGDMYSWGGFTIMSYNGTTSAHWGGFGNQAGGSIRLVNRNTGLGEGEEGAYIGNDGKIYRTICINGIEWLADNLCETKFRDGSDIQEVTDNTAWSNLTTSALCAYNNDWNNVGYEGVCSTTTTTTTEELTTTTSTTQEVTTTSTTLEPTTTTTTTCDPLLCDYGLLYNWYAVDTAKLAPTGWHVPTDAEWTTLSTYLGGEEVAGGKMKTTGLCDWAIPNTGATNESGFSALPIGWRELYEGAFTEISYYSTWWSSSVIAETWSVCWYTSYDNASLFWDYYDSGHGWGIRCLMNSPEDWYEGLKMTDIDGNDYDTVKIGNQVWTVQNLKVTHYNDGEAIPNVEDAAIWMTLTTGACCAYNNDWETYACVPEPTTTTTTTVAPTTTTTTLEPTTTTTTTEEETTTTTTTTP